MCSSIPADAKATCQGTNPEPYTTHIGWGSLTAQGADGTQGDSGSDSGVFINKIVSCVLNKNLLPYTPNGVYFVLTSSEVQINGARCKYLPVSRVQSSW